MSKVEAKRLKSIIQCFKKWSETRHPYLEFLMPDDDVSKWWIRMSNFDGNDGEFKGGEYLIQMFAPKDYPFGPPEFFYKTPTGVFEINVDVCLATGKFHKENFAAGQGGMGGYACQLLNSMIFWKDLGPGINIMDETYHCANREVKRSVEPRLLESRKRYAAASREYNRKKYPDIIRQFDESPFNIALNEIPQIGLAPRVEQLALSMIRGN